MAIEGIIAVSAGHHPDKKGATFQDFNEFDEAMFWASEIVRRMGPRRAVLIPTGPLHKKTGFANSIPRVSAAAEIHFNSAHDAAGVNVGRGCETLYYPGSRAGLVLARHVHNAMAQHFAKDRGVKEGWYRMRQDLGPDFWLKEVDAPAIILEPQFVQFKDEIREKRKACCESIASALVDYLEGAVR